MLNQKLLLCACGGGGGETPPETGYVKIQLTIGFLQGFPANWYGYSRESGYKPFGSLSPDNDLTRSYVVLSVGAVYDQPDMSLISTTRPFYYNDKKYTDGMDNNANVTALYNEWKKLSGQTVDVWIAPK